MKSKRQSEILALIEKYDIETQGELSDYLEQAGFHVTQATLSRDVREMKLSKVLMDNGRQKYAILTEQPDSDVISDMSEKYKRIFRDGFLSVDMAQNILVVRTHSGMAMAVAAALDALKMQEIVGCIAGDDTIMCAIRSTEETKKLMHKLRGIVNQV